MKLTIEVSGDLEVALKTEADKEGLPVNRIAERLLAQAVADAGRTPKVQPGEAKARAFVEWARSHRDTPPLSDDAVSRASLNPDRW